MPPDLRRAPRPMPHRAPWRALVAAVIGGLLLTGCTTSVAGSASPGEPPVDNASNEQLPIVGATDDPIDVLARNALVDLNTYWAQQFPPVYGEDLPPLAGGYFSVDPGNVDRSQYPDGIGCESDPLDVEQNAFYCDFPGVANSDSISYDRAFLAELADGYGRFIPALVMAHEFGHAVQGRVGFPQASIAAETQADCFAGTWTAWVAAGNAAHSRIRAPELDDLLRGYVTLRDPVGSGVDVESAHGSYFDRVSAFQEGFDSGAPACRDNFEGERVFTQGEFSDRDMATGGNASYEETQGIIDSSLPAVWDAAFTDVFDREFTAPSIEPFDGSPPGCAPADADLVYCRDDGLVGYDERDLAQPAYDEIGDFAVATAVAIPYALAARDQLERSTDDDAAIRSAVCLAGYYAARVFNLQAGDVEISPGDVDESVQFLLTYGDDASVLPDVGLTGFQLVDLFRNGFLQGLSACDVGL